MKTNTLITLAVIAAVVVVAAALLQRGDRAQTPSAETSARLFPGLADKLNSVATISVKNGDKEFSFKKTATGWDLPDKGGYPAKPEEVRKTLVSLVELRQGEAKTSKPDLYSKIGVQDPDGKKPEAGATAPTLFTLKDDKDVVVASAIVGSQKYGSPPGTYIRKTGEAQSWLAVGQLEVPGDPIRWLDTQFLSIERDRMKSATLTQPGGETLRVSKTKREDANFTVHDLPAGKELKYAGAGDGVGSALSSLTFEDVAPADTIDFEGKAGGKPGNYGEFRTFDGLMIAVQLTEKDGKTWAKFAAYSEAAPPPAAAPAEAPKPEGDKPATQPDPNKPAESAASTPVEAKPAEAKPADTKPGEKKSEDVKKEADEINAKLAKWAFALPPYKVTSFNAKMLDMIKSDQPPTPPPAMEGTTPLLPPPGTGPAQANPAPKQ